jgi:peptidoglycan/LPS O-acetylase OafA/YrhL
MNQPGQIDVLDRDPALDGVRGLAVALVLVFHGMLAFDRSVPWSKVLTALTDWMFVGVDLFFVLSGFLITSILIRTRGAGGYFGNFYARRALRIFPAYYLVLVSTYLMLWLLGGSAVFAQTFHDAPYFLLYLQNGLMAWRDAQSQWAGLDHTWSLAIEEQFYLIWPSVVWLTLPQRLLGVALLFAAGSVLIKCGMIAAGVGHWSYYVASFSHGEGLALGAALAAWHGGRSRGAPLPRWYRGVGAAAALGFAADVFAHMFGHGWGRWFAGFYEPLVVTAFAWLIGEILESPPHRTLLRFFASQPLRLLGQYSYGLYLIHFVVLMTLYKLFFSAWQARFGVNGAAALSAVLMYGITALLALAMFHAVERPILRLKRYFAPRRQGGAAAASLTAEGGASP